MDCFICGRSGARVELRRKRFQIMFGWYVEWVCRECFELDGGEERDGNWEDSYGD